MDGDGNTAIAVKGNSLKTLVEFIGSKFGPDGLERWTSSLHPEAEEAVRGTVLASTWYEGEHFVIGTRMKVCELFYGGDINGARDIGRFSAERSLKGIYKVFIRFGSPNWIVTRTSLIFSSYFRPGTVEMVVNEKGRANARIVGFPDHTGVVEQSVAGFSEKALVMSGANDVDVQVVKSLSRGDEYAEYEVTWT